MARERLTAQRVAGLVAPGRQIEVRDTLVVGLILRVSPGGVKSWSAWGRPRGTNRPVRVGLGRWPDVSLADAREAARNVLQKMRARIPRQYGAPRKELTVAALAEACLSDLEPRLAASTIAQWRLLERNEIVPRWGKLCVHDVTRAEIEAGLAEIAQRAPYVANRVGELIRRVMNWAVQTERLDLSPLQGLRMPTRERHRERVLGLEEVRDVWGAAASHRGGRGDAIRLLILTGARLREVLGMRWDGLDLSADPPLWTIPGSARKGGEPLVLPLSVAAVELLRARRGRPVKPTPWVFPGRAGGPSTSASHLAEKMRAKSGVTFRLHDLRRTVASHLAAHGTPEHVVEAILGHSRPHIVRIYQRYAPLGPMREALQWWAQQVIT